jgi:hypothetical protein
MMGNKYIWRILSMVGMIIAAFTAGWVMRSTGEVCDPIIVEKEKVVITHDTVMIPRVAELHWKPKSRPNLISNQRPMNDYLHKETGSETYIEISPPTKYSEGLILEPHWISDSIRVRDVGLTFNHLVRGEIMESDYKVYYPELRINSSTVTDRVVRDKQGFLTAVSVMVPIRSGQYPSYYIDGAGYIGYRYMKLSVMAGISWPSSRVGVMVIREF